MSDAVASGARARRATRSDARVDQQPGFVLHATPWRETSLIVEVLTRDFGRLGLVARGAKRPTSQFRGMLSPFAPVALSWSGRGEVKSLIRADWVGGLAPLRGEGLLAAFYMNELLVRLLARGDPHEGLFASYVHTLHRLASESGSIDLALRGFELDLLRDSGWLPPLDVTVAGEAVVPERQYRIDPEHGPLSPSAERDDPWRVSGAALLALAARTAAAPEVAAECRRLLRALVGYRLQGRPLNTRRILADLRRL